MFSGYFEYSDYQKIILKAIEYKDSIEISELFSAVHLKHKTLNPRFAYLLLVAIFDLRELYNTKGWKDIPIFKTSGKTIDETILDRLDNAAILFCDNLQITKTGSDGVDNAADNNGRLTFNCDNKQVYDVFRQLKSHSWIDCTFEELAYFIFNNVAFKDDKRPTYSTIRREIAGKDKRPIKSKRFNLPDK